MLGGRRYTGSQNASQTRPARPVTTNAVRQPQVSASQGTNSGATIADVRSGD